MSFEVCLLEQAKLSRVRSAMLAYVLKPPEAETNIGAHADTFRKHAEWHDLSI